jgi:hypothetical protein
MKNLQDSIGNQTRNLSACSAVPQPTAPPRIIISVNFMCRQHRALLTEYHRCQSFDKKLYILPPDDRSSRNIPKLYKNTAENNNLKTL